MPKGEIILQANFYKVHKGIDRIGKVGQNGLMCFIYSSYFIFISFKLSSSILLSFTSKKFL